MQANHPTNLDARLTAADREIEREQIVQKLRAMGGVVPDSKGATSETELAFFRNVLAWEEGPFITQRMWFERRGLNFAPPGELKSVELEKEMWRLIAALAGARVFISYTNHLNDAELYHKLWHDVLADEVPDIARNPRQGLHWDFSGSDGEDLVAWLTFYASDDEREDWLAEFPEKTLPPRRRPPCDRDQMLPAM